MRKLLSAALAVLVVLSLAVTAFAASDEAEEAASALYSLGLFQGTAVEPDGSPVFDLDRAPTRAEAVTMLVRLLGAEREALSGSWSTPFTDVAEWAEPYVGYAYEHGLTDGTGETSFGGGAGVTAAQYLTFVLRALGYGGDDFDWESAWTLTDELGITDGQYGPENNASFTRGDTAVVSYAALDARVKGTGTPLRDTIEIEPSSPDLSERGLSDAQISALLRGPASAARAAISTVADARAYLDRRYPSLWMSYHLWEGQDASTFVLRSGEEILSPSSEAAGRGDMVTAMTYLLSDDMDICSLYAFVYSDSDMSIYAVNRLKDGDGFYIFDPVKGFAADKGSLYSGSNGMPDATVSSIEEYAALVSDELGDGLAAIYAVSGGVRLRAEDEGGMVTLLEPAVQPCYRDDSIAEKMYGHIKPENITEYDLPHELGGLTLSVEEAKALVGAAPGTVKAKVRTAGDLLMYMLARRITLCSDFSMQVGKYDWHYNYTAKEVMELGVANCGASANLANYLLEGDYDEVGFILQAYYPGNGGGHVYNYIKYEGSYYIVDFSSYLFSNYSVENEQHLMRLGSLAEYGPRVGELYGGVSLVLAHTSPGQHLPNVFGEDYGSTNYYIPADADYQLLYEASDSSGYKLATLPLDYSAAPRLNWRNFW